MATKEPRHDGLYLALPADVTPPRPWQSCQHLLLGLDGQDNSLLNLDLQYGISVGIVERWQLGWVWFYSSSGSYPDPAPAPVVILMYVLSQIAPLQKAWHSIVVLRPISMSI